MFKLVTQPSNEIAVPLSFTELTEELAGYIIAWTFFGVLLSNTLGKFDSIYRSMSAS